MSINPDYLRGASAKDVYISLMSKEEREDALSKGRITKDDLKRVGAELTAEERDSLFTTMPLALVLLLVAKSSLAKTEMDLEEMQNELTLLNDQLTILNNAIANGTELSSKKEEVDQMFFLYDKHHNTNPPGLDSLLETLKRKYGDKVDIAIFIGDKPGEGMNSEGKGIPAKVLVEKLQTIAGVLNNEVKVLSQTKITKAQSTHNTLLELLSFLSKAFKDATAGPLARM